MRVRLLRALCATALVAAVTSDLAAGGHHAIDDAVILQRGACEIESWHARATDGERLLHAGVGCGLGLVEVGLARDYTRLAGATESG